jgi:hypothetical protein
MEASQYEIQEDRRGSEGDKESERLDEHVGKEGEEPEHTDTVAGAKERGPAINRELIRATARNTGSNTGIYSV